MRLSSEERVQKKDEFLNELTKLYNLMTFESSETEKINDQFTVVIAKLSYFETEMLPYSAASKFIYEINDADVEYFFEFFQEMLADRMEAAPAEEVFKKATKLIEHLELASSQKAYLFQKQEQQLQELNKKMLDVHESLEQYENSKVRIEQKLEDFAEISEHLDSFNESIHNFENKMSDFESKTSEFESKVSNFDTNFKEFEGKFERIEKSTEQITVNLISILGIFASILLGAYGAIQGFANIFSNANKISIGKILMLSSIGASAILLILFFLMSSIARLTDRKYGNEGIGFINRHPIMFFSHCILSIIFTAGVVIELIKYNITPQMNWIWGLLFIVIVVQVLFIYHTKSLWGILKYLIIRGQAFKDTLLYLIIVILIIIIFMYSTGYID